MTTEEMFLARLADASAVLCRAYFLHLNEYRQMLTHVLLGDFTRVITERALEAGGSVDALAELDRILELFEEALQIPDEDLRELILASFLENLEEGDAATIVIEQRMGPLLREQLRLHRGD